MPFWFEALESAKISSYEPVSSQKYRTKICDLTVFADNYMRLLDQLWQKAESGALHNAGMLHNRRVSHGLGWPANAMFFFLTQQNSRKTIFYPAGRRR